MRRFYYLMIYLVGFLWGGALPFLCDTAWAQDYRFAVPRMNLEIYIEPDAAARMEYGIQFENQRGAHAIDIVDIGLPHPDYSLQTMSATVDGEPVGPIRPSEYIDIGVEVHLGARSIGSGRAGQFGFACRMPDLVYRDTTDSERAAFQIKPTWFDPKLQIGSTQLQIAIHLPPGIAPEEVTYHSEKLRYDDLVWFGEGDARHVVARWHFADQILSSQNPKVGLSFPRRVMDRVVIIGPWGLLVRWFAADADRQILSGILLMTCSAFLFFRFSGGTGWVVYLVLAGLLVVMMIHSPAAHLAAWPVVVLLILVNEWARRRRGTHYLPAIAAIEGGGIKRGLTAPQAAVLLELPLSRVLTLVVFGLLKKGILAMKTTTPLTVEVAPPFRQPRKKRLQAAATAGTVIRDYENPFIDLLLNSDKPVPEIDFSQAIGQLVQGTVRLMKGYDLAETKAYYERIVSKAWSLASKIGELKQRSAMIDKNLDWLLVEPDADRRFERWHGGGYHYWPTWTFPPSRASTPAPASAGPRAPVETSFGEVASSFAGWTENTAGNLAASIDPASMGFEAPSASLVDLSAVDRITSDVFKGLSEGLSSGGGGGGGGCACACAGCACACACAGGGR